MSLIRVREFCELKSAAAAPTESDLALLAAPEYAGPAVTAEDVHVRRMLLCHDQYDRTYERFTAPVLKRFAETAPGKSVLPGHEKEALPLGRFFHAKLEKRTEEFPVLIPMGPKPRKAEGGIPGFESRSIPVQYLAAGFYFVADASTEALRKNIDLGVYRWVSIGFRYDRIDCDVCKADYLDACPHYFGQVLADGAVVTGTYGGDPKGYEMREGSIVFLGAQPRARLERQLREGAIDPAALAATPEGEDLVALKGAEALARRYGHAVKSWAFPGLKVSPRECAAERRGGPMDEEKREQELNDLRQRAERAEADLKAATARAEGVEKRLADADALIGKVLKDLGDEFLGDVTRLKEPEALPRMIVETLTERRDYERLRSLRDEKRTEVLEKIPHGASGSPPDLREGEGAGRPSRRLRPLAMF